MSGIMMGGICLRSDLAQYIAKGLDLQGKLSLRHTCTGFRKAVDGFLLQSEGVTVVQKGLHAQQSKIDAFRDFIYKNRGYFRMTNDMPMTEEDPELNAKLLNADAFKVSGCNLTELKRGMLK